MTLKAPERFVAVRPIGVAGSEHFAAADRALATTGPDVHDSRRRHLPEFEVLAPFVADPGVTDVFVNGRGEVWLDSGDGLEQCARLPFDERGVRELAVRLIALGGRHIDEASPCIDVRLHDGIRVHAVLPPISPEGTLLSIRLPRVHRFAVNELAESGFFDAVPAAAILDLVHRRANILVTGAAGSGKTTLLSAILATAPPTDRLIAIEDVAELRVEHPHFVSLEARQANLEGAGEVTLGRLVREALRMRPDRLILGECRGEEVRELFSALNTGHDGGAGTLHANSLEDVPARLEALGALAGLDVTAVATQAASAVDAVIHVERSHGVRRIAQLGSLAISRKGRLVAEAWTGGALADA